MKKFKKIYIEITNICNLNCSFCSKDKRKKREMNLLEFEKILKKIDFLTDYLYLHVKGEPLLHSCFSDILFLCNQYHKKVNITTNGTLLKEQLEAILNSSVRQVNISLHSLIKLEKLNEILTCGDILSKHNIQVEYRIWVENKYQNWIVNQIQDHYHVIIDLNIQNIKLSENLYLNQGKEFIWPNLKNPYFRKKGTCYGMRTHIGILADGTVIPCCLDSDGIISLGNIFEEDMDVILNKERSQMLKEGFQNNKLCEELCQKCGFQERR